MPALSYCNSIIRQQVAVLAWKVIVCLPERFCLFFFGVVVCVCCLKTIQRLINGDRVFDQANPGVQQASVQWLKLSGAI